MNKPLISIIIPAYNAAEFMGETLDSVFAQTFTNHEVIVINDGSPDTEQLEQVLQRYPSNLRYIKQENQGAAVARNTGLRAATGEFVAFLDADDTWLPEFLEKQLALLKSNGADLVFADALLSGDSQLHGRTFMQLNPVGGEVTAENLLALKVTVLTSTVLARRSPVLDVGLFDVSLRRGQDFDLWFRLAKAGARFAYTREVLAHHRIVESGLSGGTISQLKRTLSVLEAIKARANLTGAEEAALQWNLNRTWRELALENGKEKLLERDFPGALQSFNEAQKFRHSWKVVFVCVALKIAPDTLRRIYTRREMAPAKSA
ncbi:MAG TPA: glycosyltransferase family A protein [Pyrinomonadaceae bacterium]|nr:glycosyltransferase family A protein [Pyrinomonadaceae bacterium]